MVYWSIEPPLAERMELGFGMLCSLLANIHRDPKQGKTFGPADFMPRYFEAEEPEGEEDGMAAERIMPVMEGFLERQKKRDAIQRRRNNGAG